MCVMGKNDMHLRVLPHGSTTSLLELEVVFALLRQDIYEGMLSL